MTWSRLVVSLASIVQIVLGALIIGGQVASARLNIIGVVIAGVIIGTAVTAFRGFRTPNARRSAIGGNATIAALALLGVAGTLAVGGDSPYRLMVLGVLGLLVCVSIAGLVGLLLIGLPENRTPAVAPAFAAAPADAVAPGPRPSHAARWIIAAAAGGGALLLIVIGLVVVGGLAALNEIRVAETPGLGQLASHRTDGAGHEFPELNFRLERTPAGWHPIAPSTLNNEASIALMRRGPEAYFVLIAEQIGVEAATSTEALAEVARVNLMSGAERWEFLDRRPYSIHGLDGLRLETDARVAGVEIFYVHWVCAHNGFLYQLITWGKQAERERVGTEADRIIRHFRLIEPERVVRGVDGAAIESLSSDRYGYHVALPGPGWRSWDDLADTVPDADGGALHGVASAFLVVPVCLVDDKAPLEGLLGGLLSRLDIEYPGVILQNLRRVDHQGRPAYAFDHQREAEGIAYRCRFRVIKGERLAWLVGGWTASTEQADVDTLERIIEMTRLDDGAGGGPGLDAATLSERERRAHSLIYNEVGLYLYRLHSYERAADWFRRGFLLTASDAVILGNALDAWTEVGRTAEALTLLETHLATFPGDLDLGARRAYLLAQRGDELNAIEAYEKLLERGFRDDTHLVTLANLLADRGRIDEALAHVDRFMEGGETLPAAMLRARLLARGGNAADAVAVLRESRDRWPGEPEIVFTLIETMVEAELYREAIAECDELIASGRESSRSYFMKGYAELSLGWYREAKASFEIASRQEPANESIRSYVEHVSGLLGEGSNSSIKTPIEPVRLPEGVAAVPPVPGRSGHVTSYALRSTAVRFAPGAPLVTTDRYVVDVRDQAGVSRFGSFGLAFDPLAETIFVNHLVVTDASGREIARGEAADYYVLDDTTSGLASYAKTLNVPVSGLQSGCRIDLMVTRRDLVAAETFRYQEHLFTHVAPTDRRLLYVEGEVDRVAVQATPGIASRRVGDGMLWMLEDAPAFVVESRQAGYDRFMPVVWLADRNDSWPAAAQTYLDLIGERLVADPADPAVAAVVERLVEPDDTPEERVARLARFVQRELVYQGIEFGHRALVPNAASRVLADRYGDCKDHSVLLQQLLAAAGVESHLALVNATGPIRTDLPALEQFNHMIVFVPGLDGGRFIDCTSKDTDAMLPVPYLLAGKQTLVLDAAAPRLVRIGRYTPEHYRIASRTDMTLGAGGDVGVTQTLRFGGYSGALLRAWLRSQDDATRTSLVQSLLGSGGDQVHLRRLRIENLDTLDQPLVVDLEYDVLNCFDDVKGQLVGRLPLPFVRGTLTEQFIERRRTPFEIHFPMVYHGSVRLKLPADRTLADIGAPPATARGDFLAWQVKVEPGGGEVTVHFELARRAGIFEASKYATFQSEMQSCADALRTQVVLTDE